MAAVQKISAGRLKPAVDSGILFTQMFCPITFCGSTKHRTFPPPSNMSGNSHKIDRKTHYLLAKFRVWRTQITKTKIKIYRKKDRR